MNILGLGSTGSGKTYKAWQFFLMWSGLAVFIDPKPSDYVQPFVTQFPDVKEYMRAKKLAFRVSLSTNFDEEFEKCLTSIVNIARQFAVKQLIIFDECYRYSNKFKAHPLFEKIILESRAFGVTSYITSHTLHKLPNYMLDQCDQYYIHKKPGIRLKKMITNYFNRNIDEIPIDMMEPSYDYETISYDGSEFNLITG